jgi:phosphoglucomutase
MLNITELPTSPIEGQKPGTSGLRKKTKIFQSGQYLHNFVQSVFDALPQAELLGSTIVVSGDGRYYTPEAIQLIVKIAAANGVARVWIGQHGLLSTPAVSAVIREREGGIAYGGIILTASHNPGGPDEDFGIKYNTGNGGPAPESVTEAIFSHTKSVRRIKICSELPDVDINVIGSHSWSRDVESSSSSSLPATFTVEVIDAVKDYEATLSRLFDFPKLKSFLSRPDFSICYDGMSGVAGPYARRILGESLGVPASSLTNCDSKPDFGGKHPDPNLTYAHDLVETMGLTREGTVNAARANAKVPDFGAAQDGDADRNMVLGARFFVTPSDSVAIIAANQAAIPFFARAGGLKGVARSMPTSCAVDRVALKLGIRVFEVPTGWKFFGNLMDSKELGKEDFNPFLCGEESFGTGSDHVREKDGLWAVLAWLSILAHANEGVEIGKLVSVEAVVRRHWATYGRNFYCRYDYENVASLDAEEMMKHLGARIGAFVAAKKASSNESEYTETISSTFSLSECDEFRYVDPVDGSVSEKQGLRFVMKDGSRIVYRLSGTGSVGATVRVYIERYEPDPSQQDVNTAEALKDLSAIATGPLLGDIEKYLKRKEPTVIT